MDENERTASAGVEAQLAEAAAALRGFADGPARTASDEVAQAFERAGVRIAKSLGGAAGSGETAFKRLAKVVLEEFAKIALQRVFTQGGAQNSGTRGGDEPLFAVVARALRRRIRFSWIAIMAQLIFSQIGQALGARLAPNAFRALGAAIGQAGGAALGRAVDDRLFGSTLRREGARLTDLHLQGSTEGASLPATYGRVRIAGQVIWAARFKEREETTSSGGGKGGPRVRSTDYRYTLSFAVGLCEGEISRIGRVWANGEPFDLSGVNWRVHHGGEDQAPDALIEAIEGAENAPAYRGLAYVVFEDLPLERFGNTIPQLSFEIVRPASLNDARLEAHVRGVCMIPGSGEFAYATIPVMRENGPGQEAPENVHAEAGRANFLVALDQLKADLPACESVMLVVAWFGDDLRCGHCQIRPGVEIAEKVTIPALWRAGGVARDEAYLVSTVDGAPAYGGTPADASVVQAIAELKARGYKVVLHPFLLMDVPAENVLPDPYGGAAQAAYPWRGRITLSTPAIDKTGAALDEISVFFGDADAGDFSVEANGIDYDGPAEWSYRRFVLHNAWLATQAGGVDAFLIGSELRGLTTARDGAANFPAVAALQTLASDVRGVLGGETKITYAADWSEYAGHQPQDGSGDVFFHLDPLWADPDIDMVGVDWYPPLTDWRDGRTHLDAALARDIYDPDYLAGLIEAGEGYDWFYADDADRAAQVRTPIGDDAHSEPWIYRAKDVRNFWARAHYNRPGGVRASTPTAWVPKSKPIWFTELGCPAVDKGANAPNLFIDDKSAESALPPFSNGARDDLIQRRTLEAYFEHWNSDGNPTSEIYGGPMLPGDGVFVWCWDARPHPAFPAREDVWADGAAWRRGHWLSGRAGLATLADVVADICARAGVTDANVAGLSGAVSGYVVDAPVSARDALEPLMAAHAFDAREQAGQIVFSHLDDTPITLTLDDLTADAVAAPFALRADRAETPIEARVRFLDPARDYLIGAVSARRRDNASGGVALIDAPLALESEAAERIAARVLAVQRAQADELDLAVGPAHMALEPGDRVTLGEGGVFEIARIEDAETRRLSLRRAYAGVRDGLHAAEPSAPPTPAHAPRPVIAMLDLPPLPGAEEDERPLAAVFAAPWTGAHEIYAGASDEVASLRTRLSSPAIMGELLWDLWPGPVGRWDEGNKVRVRLFGGALSSVSKEALLQGANAFAIESDAGEWEIIQAREAVLVAPNEYELSGFLRGQQASAHAMRAPAPAGTRIIKLDARLSRVDLQAHEWGEALRIIAPPAAAPSSDARAARITFTPIRAAARAWPPAHVRARRGSDGSVAIRWARRARIGGDSWGPGEPPLGASIESYRVEILSGGSVVRSIAATIPEYVYSVADQTADFGAPPSSLRVRIAQISDAGTPGLNTDVTLPL